MSASFCGRRVRPRWARRLIVQSMRASRSSASTRTSSEKISSEVLGNFYANGLQEGLYLKEVMKEGNIVLNRKDLGSTADSIRTCAFLEAIGNVDGFNIQGN